MKNGTEEGLKRDTTAFRNKMKYRMQIYSKPSTISRINMPAHATINSNRFNGMLSYVSAQAHLQSIVFV